MKIDRKAFLDAATAAARPVSRTLYHDALQCVALAASGDKLTVRGTDLDLWVEAEAPCDGDLKPIGLNASRLVDALSTLRGEVVEIRLGEKAALTEGTSKRQLPFISGDKIPPSRDVGEGESVTVDGDALSKALGHCLAAVDPDEPREALRGINFADREGLTIAGTDGSSFCVYPLSVNCGAINATASVSFCKTLKALASGPVELFVGSKSVAAKIGSIRLVGPLLQASYPGLHTALIRDEQYRLTVHPSEIKAAVAAVRGFGPTDRQSGSSRIVMELGDDCALTASDVVGQSHEPFDAKFEGEPVRFGISSSRLQSAVEVFGNEPVLIEADDPSGRLKISSENLPGIITAVAFMRA